MTATPSPSSRPIVIRDWPLITVTGVVVVGAWIVALTTGDPVVDSWIDTVTSLVFSGVVLAMAAVPHVRIDEEDVHVRRLIKSWTLPLDDLIGIDAAISLIFRQRIPRLVRMDATTLLLPPRAFAWGRLAKANRRAVDEIGVRAAALGNELTIQI